VKKVTFLGLYNFYGLSRLTQSDFCGSEIWTLNDWYQFYPCVKKPDRVFNIHKKFKGHITDASRFSGNWIDEYNNSGAWIYILDEKLFPLFKKARLFPEKEAVEVFGKGFFSSTINCMFAIAIMENFKEIELAGFNLLNTAEHDNQLPGIMYAIQEAEKQGIKVIAPMREKWDEFLSVKKVDWKNIDSDIVPYWMKGVGHPVMKVII
jgi:hypothetical protein